MNLFKTRTRVILLAFLTCIFPLVSIAKDTNKEFAFNRLPKDTNEYRVINFDNGLELVLIHDKEAKITSVSYGVGVGSWDEPEDQLGIAHFLEHMLYLKSEKYPNPGEFSEFVQSNGGQANAFTTPIHTVYYFSIADHAFKEALDRVVASITEPQLDIAYVSKEINAVDSEWRLRKDQDGFAVQQAFRTIINKKHPASRFNIGNKDTLSAYDPETLVTNLEKFHSTYYTANNSKVAIYSALPLDDLEAASVPLLQDIKSKNVMRPKIKVPRFGKDAIGKRIILKAKNSSNVVAYIFPFQEKNAYWKEKPGHVFSKVVGGMHEGSLFSRLREEGLIHQIHLNVSRDYHDNAGSVTFSVEYTEKGRSKEADVLAAIFAYVKEAEKSFITPDYLAFVKERLELEIDDAEPYEGLALTNNFVRRDPNIPMTHFFDSNYILSGYSKSGMERVFDAVRPDNIIILDRSPKAEVTEEMAYTSEKMGIEDADVASLVKTSKRTFDFKAPERVTISKNETEYEQTLTAPKLLVDKPGLQARLMHSQKFKNHEGLLKLVLRSSLTSKRVEEFVHSHVLHNLMHKENRLLAEQVGNKYDVNFHDSNNIFAESNISLSGPTENHLEVLEGILRTYRAVDITQEKIDIETKPYIESMEGMSKAGPLHQMYFKRADMLNLYPNAFSAQERIQGLKSITVESLKNFRDAYLKAAFIDIYAFGNYKQDQILKAAALAEQYLGERKGEFVRLAKGDEYDFSKTKFQDITFDIDVSGVGFALEYVSPVKSLEMYYQANMLATLMHPKYFDALRTEKKLAYSLGVYATAYDDHPGITLYIHSNVADFDVISESIEAFITAFSKEITTLSDEDIQSLKTVLKENLLKEPGNVYEEAGEYLNEWSLRPEQYKSKEKHIAAIDSVNAEQIKRLFKDLIKNENAERFRYQVRGNDSVGAAFLK